MFHRFEDTVNQLTNGTMGYFCLRCHAPVAVTMGLRRDQPIWDGPMVFREGVTCIACHRVKTPYVKVNGERRIEPGDIHEPIYGAGDGTGVEIVNKYSQHFKTKTSADAKLPGQAMHRRAIQFEELSESTFCMSCHQVAVHPGIKLEVVWDQYRASPAYREGVTCQDCHMGKIPGVDGGYSVGPAAVVAERVVNPERKHSNHVFHGPGYSIAHPGVWPFHKASERWKFNDWLEFDWRAGWGTDEFEDQLNESADGGFPPAWRNADDRCDAREIIDDNLKKLAYKKDLRRQILENGSKLDGPFFIEDPQIGAALNFYYCITNTNPGHNMPSGSLGAQPQIWLNVVLIDPTGRRVWESGHVDSNGDLCDIHSYDVQQRRLPLDKQLFNLQTKFLTTNVKGTDREMLLPIPLDADQLPFIRPAAQPVTVINHPPTIRMEGHSLPALGSRNARFSVPKRVMQKPGTYRLSVRMRSRAEPIYFMRFCNSTPEMERMMNEWMVDFHANSAIFAVD
jgi:nitrate/TMAO reductase-like tetraheme cytochrome c subunit